MANEAGGAAGLLSGALNVFRRRPGEVWPLVRNAPERQSEGLSQSYYAHKRSALLFCTALFIASLPHVSLSSLPGISGGVSGLSPEFVRLMLFAAATYYMVYFGAIWAREVPTMLRFEDLGADRLEQAIKTQLQEIAEARSLITAEITTLRQSGDPRRIDEALMARGIVVAADDVLNRFREWRKEVSAKLGERVSKTLDDTLRGAPTEILHSQYATSYRAVQGKIQQAIKDVDWLQYLMDEDDFSIDAAHVLGGREVHALREFAAGNLIIANRALVAAQRALRGAVNGANAQKSSRLIMTHGLDLAAPILLYVLAAAHFIGINYWPALPSLPAALELLHLLPQQ